MIAEAILEQFEIHDQFKSVYQDDVGDPFDDPDLPRIYDNAGDLAADMAKRKQPWRHMEHRFVAITDWERVEAQISWEYDR